MLNRCLVISSICMLLLSATVKADNKVVPENGFKALLGCMKKVPIDVKKLKGMGSSQVVLLSVLEEVNQSKASERNLDIDYSEIFKLVEKNCPKELEVVKRFSATKPG